MKDTTYTIRTDAPVPPIRLGSRTNDARHERAQRILLVFMRVVAIIWMGEGLVHWADLLIDNTGQDFTALSAQRVTAVFFFCVLDFVAAIGLWLKTPWGAVVWFVTVGVQALSLVSLPGFWHHAVLLVLTDLILVAAYLVLAWQANREFPSDG